MTRQEYDSIEAVNWSTLRSATVSAKHYQHALAAEQTETDPMRLGRATHTAVFEPDNLLREYVVWEGGTRRGKEWEAFKAMHEHKTILLPQDYEKAVAIRDAVRAHEPAMALLGDGEAERTLTWTDKGTGLACKARLDWLGSALVDLKTTRDIDARAFGRHAGSMMYHCQLAFYAMGAAANGCEPPVYIIAVESDEPHDVAVYELDENVLWAGECKVQQALELVARCRETGEWPGRYPEVSTLALPVWEFPSEDEEDLLTRGAA